ncbi:Protein of unknown function [Pyronema omphalodes CBS 100304]|uniref:Uncharacterized protein n=1 Tax=Pyronema omphalodes (strain CBS 100304) TaxID=1076935 RepID=U4L178_PYROM|nr:Protein of unknown function [Pyronema omphalodes CBS 100304]
MNVSFDWHSASNRRIGFKAESVRPGETSTVAEEERSASRMHSMQ